MIGGEHTNSDKMADFVDFLEGQNPRIKGATFFDGRSSLIPLGGSSSSKNYLCAVSRALSPKGVRPQHSSHRLQLSTRRKNRDTKSQFTLTPPSKFPKNFLLCVTTQPLGSILEAKPLRQGQKTRILGRGSQSCSHLYSTLPVPSHFDVIANPTPQCLQQSPTVTFLVCLKLRRPFRHQTASTLA